MLRLIAADAHLEGGGVYDVSHRRDRPGCRRAAVIVTDNRRHFLAALRYGLRVETPVRVPGGDAEAAQELIS